MYSNMRNTDIYRTGATWALETTAQAPSYATGRSALGGHLALETATPSLLRSHWALEKAGPSLLRSHWAPEKTAQSLLQSQWAPEKH